ncbi:hypothetical protein Bca4012_003230 [Brassica carinata]
MGKFPGLMIILASSLLFFLQTLEVVNGAKCYGSLASNSSYAQNRRNLFSTLANKVLTNGGVYNASLSQYPNKVYALGLCARGFKPKACLSCLERLTLETQRDCPNIMDSFVWGSDDEDRVSCLVRSSNHSFGNLELSPPVTGISPDQIEPSINMTLFMQQWEYTVNNTLVAATKANTSSVHKYYSAVKAEFTAFPNVYMLTQCTPDITSQDCKQCLEACLKYFREQFRGRTGGMSWTRKLNNGTNEYSDSDGQLMLRFNLDMILLATADFSPENKLGQGGFGTVYKAWKRWAEGRPEVIIDRLLVKNSSVEIIKLIQTGLLCVQENATNRPTMSSVMVWLGSETITIPLPKAPAFTESHSQSEDGAMSMSNVFTELSSR